MASQNLESSGSGSLLWNKPSRSLIRMALIFPRMVHSRCNYHALGLPSQVSPTLYHSHRGQPYRTLNPQVLNIATAWACGTYSLCPMTSNDFTTTPSQVGN